mgnify:CR=1 FL=1
MVQRKAAKDLVESRRAVRMREAKKVYSQSKTLAQAAKAANCSERTIRRYVEQIEAEKDD